MAQEPPDERSDFILSNTCHNDTVAGVPQTRLKKVAVPREKGSITLSSQQNGNLLVFETLSAKVETDLSCRQSPRLEQQALSIQDILIKNNASSGKFVG